MDDADFGTAGEVLVALATRTGRAAAASLRVVPERFDRVQIQLASQRDPIAISWAARDEILSRLSPEQEPIDHAFRAVGASSPVQLTNEEKAQLRVVLDEWMQDLNPERLPDDVLDLRSALITDLNDAGRGR